MIFANKIGLLMFLLGAINYHNSSESWYSMLCIFLQYIGTLLYLYQPSEESK